MIRAMTAEEIKTRLGLEPHPIEGGWFRQIYAADTLLPTPQGPRHASTAIYYLLEAEAFSEMHTLLSDEVFHFYMGSPVEMLQLLPGGRSAVFTLGPDLAAGQHPQLVVPAGTWQGTRLLDPRPGQFALLGCTVAPGFDYADYRNASAAELVAIWPHEAERIRALTRS